MKLNNINKILYLRIIFFIFLHLLIVGISKDAFAFNRVSQFDNNTTSVAANGIPGNSFIISKGGCFNDDIKEAATFMHELGHTLGLTHGGAKDDHYVYKPNHLSIMNYLYSDIGLYPNGEINYSEYELPAINIYFTDERKGIDPNGVVKDNLGCLWYLSNNNKDSLKSEKLISGKAIDFNQNDNIEMICNSDIYFYINTLSEKVRGNVAKETINEWEHLIYKPEENSMVTENTRTVNIDGYEIDPLYEAPLGAYWFLGEDETNNYNFFGLPIYNESDDKFYYEIRLENKGKMKTIADITTDSEELKFNLKNEKIELPKHTNDTISVTKLYVPIKVDLKEETYDFPVITKDIYGNESIERGIIDLGWGGYEVIKEERRINEQLSQDKVTVIYTIDDYTYNEEIRNHDGKKYILPCEAYQKEDGTWTSDAVDNFEYYVEEVLKSDINTNYIKPIVKQPTNPPIYLIIKIGFGITMALMIALISIFIKKFIINRKDEEY